MQCEAEVRRQIAGNTNRYPGASGSRQVNEYAYGRCSRTATMTVKMYPPRGDERSSMHPVVGRVCRQHADHWLPRKWSES